jgi:hypothetical protein
LQADGSLTDGDGERPMITCLTAVEKAQTRAAQCLKLDALPDICEGKFCCHNDGL